MNLQKRVRRNLKKETIELRFAARSAAQGVKSLRDGCVDLARVSISYWKERK